METVIVNKNNYYNLDINKIEDMYKAKYVGDFSVKDIHGEWSNLPCSIFYQENFDKSKGHSEYFGMYCIENQYPNMPFKKAIGNIKTKVYVVNGKSAFETPLTGAIANNGDIIVSCYTHDYVTSPDKSVFIDGGRDYIRTKANKLAKIGINKGEFYKISEENI